MSSPLRSCEEDEGMVVNSEGGDFDEEDDDDGDPDENASDINSPAAPRETATPAAPGTVKKKREILADNAEARTSDEHYSNKFGGGEAGRLCPPANLLFLRCVSTEDKRRARRPASKFADPISEKEDTCSISPHLLLSIYERCQKKTGVLMRVFYSPLVLPHNPDNKRKV